MKNKLILDVCCGPCATVPIKRLKGEYDIILFFSNFNVYPKEEYEKRLSNTKKLAYNLGLEIFVINYDHNEWLSFIKGLEGEPENGKRCIKCYDFRLRKAAEYAKKIGGDFFAATLTLSPHKNSDIINELGKRIAGEYGIDYLEANFKKKGGFSESIRLSKEHELYRQNYCGCEFSMRSIESPKEKNL